MTAAQPPSASTLLVIGGDTTHAHAPSSTAQSGVEILPVGARSTSARYFRHDPPTPLEWEHAIDGVEDALARRPRSHDSGELTTRDLAVAALADAAGVAVSPARVLTLPAVERLFQRLVSASLGQPGAARGLPAGPEAAAVLLILREFMHHSGFEAITVLGGLPTPSKSAVER